MKKSLNILFAIFAVVLIGLSTGCKKNKNPDSNNDNNDQNNNNNTNLATYRITVDDVSSSYVDVVSEAKEKSKVVVTLKNVTDKLVNNVYYFNEDLDAVCLPQTDLYTYEFTMPSYDVEIALDIEDQTTSTFNNDVLINGYTRNIKENNNDYVFYLNSSSDFNLKNIFFYSMNEEVIPNDAVKFTPSFEDDTLSCVSFTIDTNKCKFGGTYLVIYLACDNEEIDSSSYLPRAAFSLWFDVAKGNVKITLNFLNGGGVQSDYIERGTLVNSLVRPSNGDLNFEGWYKEETLTTRVPFTDEINEDTTLYARYVDATEAYETFEVGRRIIVYGYAFYNSNVNINSVQYHDLMLVSTLDGTIYNTQHVEGKTLDMYEITYKLNTSDKLYPFVKVEGIIKSNGTERYVYATRVLDYKKTDINIDNIPSNNVESVLESNKDKGLKFLNYAEYKPVLNEDEKYYTQNSDLSYSVLLEKDGKTYTFKCPLDYLWYNNLRARDVIQNLNGEYNVKMCGYYNYETCEYIIIDIEAIN